MIKIFLYIVLLSTVGIVAFFIFLNYILHRIFHHPAVPEKRKPSDEGLEYEEVLIPTAHQKKVQLWALKPPKSSSEFAVLFVHGWANTVDSLLLIAKKVAKCCPVYMLNTRNHGKSDPENTMTIIKYETDIRHAIDYIQKQQQRKVPVVLIGHSLGGAAVLLTASEDARVIGAVSISTFSSMYHILYQGFMKAKVPDWFINSLMTYIEFRLGRTLQEISPAQIIKKLEIPVLLIHGTKDEVVEYSELEKIYKEGKKDLVEKVVAKGHSHSSLLEDENVAIAIESFIKKNFLKS